MTMPTTRPRYTVTDTGELRDILDLAQRRWPEVTDRRQLLMKLVLAGSNAVSREVADADDRSRAARQRAALERAHDLVDVEVLLADDAWR